VAVHWPVTVLLRRFPSAQNGFDGCLGLCYANDYMDLVVVVFVAVSVAGCSSGNSRGRPDAPPARQEIVFTYDPSCPADGPSCRDEVYVMNLDGSERQQITNDGAAHFLPHFSPDATKIVYTKFSVGGYGEPNAQTDVAVMDLATMQEAMITHDGRSGYPSWSPDGTRIAFMRDPMISAIRAGQGTIVTVNPDGTDPTPIAACPNLVTDAQWPGDMLWSNRTILFNVVQNRGGCINVRTDTILPDGTGRTTVSDGGSNCSMSPPYDYSGDADPGWSGDGLTIYSSRGFPATPAGAPKGAATLRKLYSFSAAPWYSGKTESDLSLPSEPDCDEGVPRGSPHDGRILLFRACFSASGAVAPGIYVTDVRGSYRTFVTGGFGPDWNPTKN
jgi:hypothetical protein